MHARRSILLLSAALLGACAASPAPMYYQLRALPARTAGAASTEVLSVGPVTLPEYLDRRTVVLRTGAAGLTALHEHRWAEPLPEAFARVLTEDLAARLGARNVWQPPLPDGVVATRRLRVEVMRFDAQDGSRHVVLAARWALQPVRPETAPVVQTSEFKVEASGSGVDALVAAHSDALARLADEIVEAAVRAGAPR